MVLLVLLVGSLGSLGWCLLIKGQFGLDMISPWGRRLLGKLQKIHWYCWWFINPANQLIRLTSSLSHYVHGFIHPRWCRTSSINSTRLSLQNLGGFSRSTMSLNHQVSDAENSLKVLAHKSVQFSDAHVPCSSAMTILDEHFVWTIHFFISSLYFSVKSTCCD